MSIPLFSPNGGYRSLLEETKTEGHPLSLIRRIKSLLFALLPTYFQFLFYDSSGDVTEKLHSTAWLDGLRGVAALIVSIYHYCQPRFLFWNGPFFPGPYVEGDGMAVDWTNPFQLPIIRLGYSGVAMVPIFFIISGYVLSLTKVRSIRQGNFEKLSEQLFSSTVRRGFRLFPPVFVVLALYQIQNYFYNTLEEPTFDIISILIRSFKGWNIAVSDVFKVDYREDDIHQFWTIPVEFTDSIILFAVTMGVSRMGLEWRIGSVSAMAIYAFLNGYWGVYLFLIGLVMAEVETIWQATDDKPKSLRYYLFWVPVFVTGLILAGYPSQQIHKDPILNRLPSITPKVYYDRGYHGIWYFWVTVAAPMVVWPMFRLPRLQRLFTTPFAIYLGKVSYALYAIHYAVIYQNKVWVAATGDWVFGNPTNKMLPRTMGFLLEVAIMEFMVFWAADIFWRFVDQPTVRLAKSFEKMVRSY